MSPSPLPPMLYRDGDGVVARAIAFCLENRPAVFLGLLLILAGGLITAPFDWGINGLPRHPVPVDAIPDLGENQQVVWTDWPGRSPQDIEDQITYPLTTQLLSVRGVKTVRSLSMFGFSSIYVVFEEGMDFYWSRDRVQERLNQIPPGDLPAGVRPRLGPDATPLGQVFWYTLEGRDPDGNPTGGWDLHELRSIQDWQVRQDLMSVPGVAEVASVGGFVQEYQVEVDPDLMRSFEITLPQLVQALRNSNTDSGARTIEINRVEYMIRGLGRAQSVTDLEETVIAARDHTPIRVKDVARVKIGPALRRGLLDKDGTEAVGGVVVAQYGENPMAVIQRVKERIETLTPALPSRQVAVRNSDGSETMVASRVTIVPFYDRSGLIEETLDTLGDALVQQILVTVLVVVLMLSHLRASLLISLMLPFTVLLCFIAMRVFNITANVVALAGIAIAIGTIVDMGVVLIENILEHRDRAREFSGSLYSTYAASREVGSAVLTAVATTVIGFLPVFFLIGDQGKLYRPLAYTKTFALLASLGVALLLLPPLAHLLLGNRPKLSPQNDGAWRARFLQVITTGFVLWLLTTVWMPIGFARGTAANFVTTGAMIGALLLLFHLFLHHYESILRWCLAHKRAFLLLPVGLLLAGLMIGSSLGRELMPRLDEGAFLYMPSAMPHASIGEVHEILRTQDMAIRAIPEVKQAVGKLGRVESALDPAPIGMIETLIEYKPEFQLDAQGNPRLFAYHSDAIKLARDEQGNPHLAPDGEPYRVRGVYARNADGSLIPDPQGHPFRVWRRALAPALNPGREAWPGIQTTDDIWNAIVRAAEIPGVTIPSKLGPIETRLVMLQSGIKGRVGLRVIARGRHTQEDLQAAGLALQTILQAVPAILPATVSSDRVLGKPYLELEIDRAAIARHGLRIDEVQQSIQAAIGGMPVTTVLQGRERYDVLVRYPRERRDSPEALQRVLVPTRSGAQIPLRELLVGRTLQFRSGPMVIKSESGGLVLYLTFAVRDGVPLIDAIEQAATHIESERLAGRLQLPAGIHYEFAGAYQKYQETMRRLLLLIPLSLVLIILILYFQFRRIGTTLIVFSGIAVAWSGGFLLIWLYGQPWFLNMTIAGIDLRELFQIHPLQMSTAIWVGFLALFGIATDDGVVMATYLEQQFSSSGKTVPDAVTVREQTVAAALRRVRPCLMTTATTILALLPVLTSTGRGSDIMVPMAIPIFGGMLIELITMFVVPVLYCWGQERFGSM